MDDDYHKRGLYRWQRQTKPRVYSRSQKVTTTNDIEAWMQKVEAASSRATEAVLGLGATSAQPRHASGREMGRAMAQGASEHAKIENEAYAEAEALLTEWITEKVNLHGDDPSDDLDLVETDPWRKQELGTKARREWDSMLNGNLEELGIDSPWTKPKRDDTDPYANIYNLDDDEAVSTVMRNMLEKEVVKDDFCKDLGFDSDWKAHDPRTKMEMRHQRVKENREKREKELERKRKDTDSKKQARLTARQMVMKEEKEKEMHAKREELEVRKEMARLRKEMQESRQREVEERTKKQQEQEELARQAREELERQQEQEHREALRRQHEISEQRKAAMARRELEKARQAAEALRILQKHFTAWYDVVLYRRLQFGKARAMADWRLRLRVWNAWRSYVRSQRVTIETKQHEQNVVEENRKTVMASRHRYLRVLRKHFTAWRVFVAQEQDKRELENAQEKTRSKMMNLLHAVADGSLGSARREGEEEEAGGKGGRMGREGAKSERSDRRHSDLGAGARRGNSTDRSKVDALFNQPARKAAWAEDSPSQISSSRSNSALSSASATSFSHQGQRLPTEAWQVTRKHVQLTKEEMANLARHDSGDQADSEGGPHSDVQIRRRFGTQPWMNRHYTVNNFEHRFTAQQKMLKEQQTAIKEQKRVIEELKFAQRQQVLRQQLPGQQGSSEGQKGLSEERQHQNAGSEASQEIDQQREEDGATKKSSPEKQVGHVNGKRHAHTARMTPAQHVTDGGDSTDAQRSELPTERTGHSDSSAVTTTSAATHTTNGQGNSRYLQVLKNMEERAAERARLKAERDEKRRQAEDARLERLKAEEEELKRKAEEEKRARVMAHREKKRLEKQKEQEKQQEAERQRELNARADYHYQKSLMKWRVLMPMKKLVAMAQANMETAATHHNHQILGGWKNVSVLVCDEQCGIIRTLLLPKLFEAWRKFTAEEKVAEAERLRLAREFYPKSLVKMVFHAWRRLPQELKREAEREKLRTEMRKKVADLLPDFQLPSIAQSTDSIA
ncbi:hypothetical protein BaRGS_00016612 [Batillaria attramentaria]|uniref:Uncharacterized protein n=1 Tax=Batillaria attramentaria TaxID=370345 RepID=A0ABD0KYV6_9CAEN